TEDPQRGSVQGRLWQLAEELLPHPGVRGQRSKVRGQRSKDGSQRSGSPTSDLQPLTSGGAGQFNQALMELGSLICTATAPRCGDCPLQFCCVACKLDLQEQIPVRSARASTIPVREAAVVVRRGSQVFLVQRPKDGRWGGLWEFPHGEVKANEIESVAAKR